MPSDVQFQILALAPFISGDNGQGLSEPVDVDSADLDRVIADFGVSVDIALPKDLVQKDVFSVPITRIKDFHPDSMLLKDPLLHGLLKARDYIKESQREGISNVTVCERLRELTGLPFKVPMQSTETQHTSSDHIDKILEMVALPDEKPASSPEMTSFTGQIDSFIDQILWHIFSNKTFRSLESVWRGLKYLLRQEEGNPSVRAKIVPASLETLEDTLDRILPSAVRELPSLIIIDLPFDNSPRSIDLLAKIIRFSDTLLAPSVVWLSPGFLGLNSWGEMSRLPFLPHHFDGPAYAKWRSLRKDRASEWLMTTCNRILARYPYGPDNPPQLTSFSESDLLWISPVWAIGALVSQSMKKTGWPTRITDRQYIRLDSLPLYEMETGSYLATEAHFGDERIDQFIRSGITPLVAPLNKDTAYLPMETNITGGSMARQSFLTRITRFLFWCRDRVERDIDPSDIETGIRKGFTELWERSGHPMPHTFTVSATPAGPGQKTIVRLHIEPTQRILAGDDPVDLEFPW